MSNYENQRETRIRTERDGEFWHVCGLFVGLLFAVCLLVVNSFGRISEHIKINIEDVMMKKDRNVRRDLMNDDWPHNKKFDRLLTSEWQDRGIEIDKKNRNWQANYSLLFLNFFFGYLIFSLGHYFALEARWACKLRLLTKLLELTEFFRSQPCTKTNAKRATQ